MVSRIELVPINVKPDIVVNRQKMNMRLLGMSNVSPTVKLPRVTSSRMFWNKSERIRSLPLDADRLTEPEAFVHGRKQSPLAEGRSSFLYLSQNTAFVFENMDSFIIKVYFLRLTVLN